jgi:hypothetical protein
MQDYISNACLALKKFRDIKSMIEESAEIMSEFKCSLSLQGTLHGDRHPSLDEADLSKAMWMQFLSKLPYCTETQRYTLEKMYATQCTFWESSNEIAWLQGCEAINLRMTEQLAEVKDWLKAGMYFEKLKRFEMNHTTIPQTQKLYCTPNVSGGREAHWWNNSRAHSLLNSLDSVLHWMTGAPQPEQLAGDKILKQVGHDIATHGTMKNKVFLGQFFILKMTVSGNSTLTLRTAAHALLTKSERPLNTVKEQELGTYSWSLDKTQLVWKNGIPIKRYDTIEKAREALNQGFAPDSFFILFRATSLETVEQDKMMFVNRIRKITLGTQYRNGPCQVRWIAGHEQPTTFLVELSRPCTVEVEAQAVEPQAVEPQAVEPQAVEPQAVESQAVEPQAVDADLEIIVQFTKKDGLLVYGNTKEHKEIIKAHGLRWLKEKQCWYVYGSRKKDDLGTWEKSRIERMILALRGAGCKIKIKIAA